MMTLRENLVAALGPGGVSDDRDDLALAGLDLLSGPDAVMPDLVLRPGNTAQMIAAMGVLAASGVAAVPRGAGLSYTGGVVPAVPSVVIDTRRLTSIAVHADDLYAVVGAGCSWAALSDALAPHGLRPLADPPISGSHATVGGAMSQGLSGAEGFIGVALVLADGTLVRTGSWTAPGGVPFWRSYGPDLTGLFIGDCGAFGVKTDIVLRLVPAGQRRFASFGFDSADAILDAIARLRRGPGGRALALDRARGAASSSGMPVTEAMRTAAAIAGRAGSVTQAVRGLVDLGRAKADLAEPAWSLHLTAEGADAAVADAQLAAMGAMCAAGRPIPPAVPQVLDARPYSVRGMVGPDGERWVPVHGILPLSAARACFHAIEGVLAGHAAAIARHGIRVNWLVMSNAAEITMESMFYWRDALDPLHASYMTARHWQRFGHTPPDLAARDFVRTLRAAVRDAFDAHRAAHHQIGRFYAPPDGTLLPRIKAALDPGRRMNPGVLGL